MTGALDGILVVELTTVILGLWATQMLGDMGASNFWRGEEHPTEGRLRMTNPTIRFSETPSTVRRLPPRLGEHSAEVLSEAGYSDSEMEKRPASFRGK